MKETQPTDSGAVSTGQPPTHSHAVTEILANYALGDVTRHLVSEAVQQAHSTLLDTIGVALAARKSELVQVLATTHPGDAFSGQASIWCSGRRADVETVAMANGASAHALDFDDTNESIRGHLATTIWPVLLALGELAGTSGKSMVEAYVVGVRTAVAIADGMIIDDHYARGWHSTSTVGVLAATCAAARLLKINVSQTRHALGLAGSMASGSRQNFGTMTKPFHAGLTARNAVLAAMLARAGFEANPSMLEGPLGYYALYGSRERMGGVERSLRQDWTPSRHGVSLKNYAVCYNLHRMCDGVLAIMERRQVSSDNVAKIHVTMEPQGKAPLLPFQPSTVLECKFSPEYVIAALILGRSLGPADFKDSILDDRALRLLMARITVSEHATPPAGPVNWTEGYAVIVVTLQSGETLIERVDHPKGHWASPFSRQEISRKFRDCVEFGFPGGNPSQLEDEIWNIGRVDHFRGFRSLQSIVEQE